MRNAQSPKKIQHQRQVIAHGECLLNKVPNRGFESTHVRQSSQTSEFRAHALVHSSTGAIEIDWNTLTWNWKIWENSHWWNMQWTYHVYNLYMAVRVHDGIWRCCYWQHKRKRRCYCHWHHKVYGMQVHFLCLYYKGCFNAYILFITSIPGPVTDHYDCLPPKVPAGAEDSILIREA